MGFLSAFFLSFLLSFFLCFLSDLSVGFGGLGGLEISGGPGAGGKVSSLKCTEPGLEVRLAGRKIPLVGEGGVAGGEGGAYKISIFHILYHFKSQVQ